jgi:hypothetical protein
MSNNTSLQIIRQSQIKTSMEIFKERNIQPTVLELITMTEALTDYVLLGPQQSVADRIRKVDEWLKTK